VRGPGMPPALPVIVASAARRTGPNTPPQDAGHWPIGQEPKTAVAPRCAEKRIAYPASPDLPYCVDADYRAAKIPQYPGGMIVPSTMLQRLGVRKWSTRGDVCRRLDGLDNLQSSERSSNQLPQD